MYGGKTSTLTKADIKLIREAMAERRRLLKEADKLSQKALAEKFNVSQPTISAVINCNYSYVNSQ